MLLGDTTAENTACRELRTARKIIVCSTQTMDDLLRFVHTCLQRWTPPTSPPHNQIPFHSIPKSIFQHSDLLLYSYCSFLSPRHSEEVFSCRFFFLNLLIQWKVCVWGGVGVAFSKGNILRQNKVSLSVRYRERYSWIHACGWSDVPSPSANEPFWVQLYF